MSGTLLIINDPPYGTERAYNALRLARALVGKDGETVRIFLIGDARVVRAERPAGATRLLQRRDDAPCSRRPRWRGRRVRFVHGRPRARGAGARRRLPPQRHGRVG